MAGVHPGPHWPGWVVLSWARERESEAQWVAREEPSPSSTRHSLHTVVRSWAVVTHLRVSAVDS